MTHTWLTRPLRHQFSSHLRTPRQWMNALAPAGAIGLLLTLAADRQQPAAFCFILILAALWVGGSACIREIADDRQWLPQTPNWSLAGYLLSKILYAAALAALQSATLAGIPILADVLPFPMLTAWAVLTLVSCTGSLQALILSTLNRTAANALAWFPLLVIPQVLFSGFILPLAPLRPFAVNFDTKQLVYLPPEMVRSTAAHPLVFALSNASVTRWGVEGLVAGALSQNPDTPLRLTRSVRLASVIPLTLSPRNPLADLATQASPLVHNQPAPAWPAYSAISYLLVLFSFTILTSLLLFLAAMIRNPLSPP